MLDWAEAGRPDGSGMPAGIRWSPKGQRRVYVAHVEADKDRSLRRYVEALRGGRSILVRPRATYDGFEKVKARLLGLTAGSAWVTDLAGTDLDIDNGRARAESMYAFHTSGSTGPPKCVVYETDTVRRHAEMVARSLQLDSSSDYVALAPCNFAYGLSIVNSHELAGVPVTFVGGSTDRLDVLRHFFESSKRPQVVYLLPQQASLLLACASVTSRLRTVIVAGGRLSGALAGLLADRYPNLELVNMYGQAELGPRLAVWRGPIAGFVEGVIGHPVEGVKLSLTEVDKNGRSELQACSPYAMRYLLEHPYAQLLPGPAAGTFVSTGDFARMSGADFVHEGRKSHFGNVAGTKIDLVELAVRVQDLVPTLDVRVSTRPSRATGDDVVLVQIVPIDAAPYSANDVRRLLHSSLGSLVSFVEVRLVDYFVLGESGK